jgi:hypothetical protein
MMSVPAAQALATDEPDRPALDEPELGQLLEPAGDPGEHRPGRDRPDDHVRRAPAQRLGDLEGERLGALGIERPEVDVDEAPAGLVGDLEAEPVDVVIGPVDRDDGRAVGQGVVHLGRLEVGRDEDVGGEAQRGGCCRGRPGEVAGRRARERLDAELDGARRGDRDRPVLEAQRRVPRVVLDPEAIETEARCEAVRRDEWRRAHRQAAGRWAVDGQQLGVAPDAGRAGGNRRAGQRPPGGPVVVFDLERSEAGGTDVRQPDRLGAPAAPTAQADDGRRRGVCHSTPGRDA